MGFEFTSQDLSQWTALQVANPKGKPTPEQAAALKVAKGQQTDFMKALRERLSVEATDKELKKALDERVAAAAKAASEPVRPAFLDACSGTRDWYPEDMRLRKWLFGHMRAASEQFGFQEYDAPVLEHVELYERKAGEEITDQMYHFTTKDDGRVTLRPEMTPSLARLILNHTNLVTGEIKEPLPLKWFSIPQCWRYETTQRGRKREHYQWNVDIAGEASIYAELELLCVCAAFFARLGIGPEVVGIRINSRRVLDALMTEVGVPPENFAKVCVVIDKLDKVGPEEVTRQLSDVGVDAATAASILKCLEAQSIEELAERVGADSKSIQEMKQLFELASKYRVGPAANSPTLGEYLQFDASVVRGLAYYTGIVFEAFDRRGVLRAIAGGGRYDKLLQLYGGEACATPMCGFGFGDCVIIELLKETNLMPQLSKSVDAVVAPYDESMREPALRVASELRALGLGVDLLLQPKRAKGAFDAANRAGARYMAFVAPGEWEQGLVRVKDMEERDASGKDGLQVDVPIDDIASLLPRMRAEGRRQAEIAANGESAPPDSDAMMAYLGEHGIPGKLNAAVNQLAISRPAEPMVALADLLRDTL